MSFSLNLGSDARSSPTTALLAASTMSLASPSARCACHAETLCEAADSPRPSSVSNTCASKSGSVAAIVGFIESYSSAIGCVACTRARSAFMSSRFRSSAQKCPSVSSSPAAKSSRSMYAALICSSSASSMPPVRDDTADGSALRSYAAFTSSNMPSILSAASASIEPRISPNMTPARQTNAEPSWNSAISVIRPPSTASPYSAIDVSSRPFMRFMRKIGSDDRPSPTIAVLAASTTPFASSTACCACSRETSVVALDFSPSSVPSMSLSSAGSLSTSVGFIESYSSAIGCVACTSASSALPSSRFCSSAQKWPSVSSSPAAKSTLSRSSDSTPPAPFANAAGAVAVAATTARASPASAAVYAAVFTGRRPAPALIRGGLSTRSCYTVLRRAAARRRSRRRPRSRPRSLAPWRRRPRCAGEKSAVRSCLGGLVQAAEPGRGGRASRRPAGRPAWQCGRRPPGAQPAASGSAPQTRPRQGRGPPGPVPVRRRRRLRRRKPCGVHCASPAVPLAKRPLSPAESARAVLRGGMRCAIKFSAHPARSGARPAIAHRRPARCAGSQARRWQERASACGSAIGRAWTGRAAVLGRVPVAILSRAPE